MKIILYNAKVEVRLKSGHVDSEGLTAKQALNDMGFEIKEVSTAKIYEIKLEANTLEKAEEKIQDMCRKLLANPVKDDYKIEVEKAE